MTPFPAPNRLHVWWARRPLVASRAAVLGALLPASVSETEEGRKKFMHLLGIHGDPVAASKKIAEARKTGIRVDNPYGYDRAFSYSPNADEIEWLKQSIRNLGLQTPIRVFDPTAGGGSIPFETIRCGFDAISNDINPVAGLLELCTIDYPNRIGGKIISVYIKIRERLISRIRTLCSDYYPSPISDSHVDMTYLFARTIHCPYCGGEIPLSPNWRLAPDGTGVRLHPDVKTGSGTTGKRCSFEIVKNTKQQSGGTVKGGDAMCPYPDCGRVVDGDEVKRQAQAGQMGERLYAIVYKERIVKKTKAGKDRESWKQGYRAPRLEDDVMDDLGEKVRELLPEWEMRGWVPTEDIGEISNYDRGHRLYGTRKWSAFFSPRQLYCHAMSVRAYRELLDEARADPKFGEIDKAAFAYIALAIDKLIDYCSRYSVWHSTREVMAHTFSKHNFNFTWSYAEMAPLIVGLGYDWAFDQVEKCIAELVELVRPGEGKSARKAAKEDKNHTLDFEEPAPRTDRPKVTVTCGSADNLEGVASASIDAVVMDPPYYNNVMYAELSDFFYVWLKRTAGELYPELFSRMLTDKDREAVANPAKFQGQKGAGKLANEDYRYRMMTIFRECRRVLKDDGIMVLMFTHKAVGAWDALTSGLMEAGFVVTASWPVNTEAEGSMHIKDKAACNSTVFLVCRPRAARGIEETIFWEDLEPTVRARVRERIETYRVGGIRGIDLYLASFGPALEVFSSKWPVRRASPKTTEKFSKKSQRDLEFDKIDPYVVMPEDVLLVARREVTEWRLAQLSSMARQAHLDALTEFFVLAWDAFEAPAFDYDEALQLARVVGLDLDRDICGKIAVKKGSDVILWDAETRAAAGGLGPADGSRAMLDALHHAVVAARRGTLQTARDQIDRAGLADDPGFLATLEAVLEVLPPSRHFTGMDLSEALAPSANDFEVLENLRRIAFSDKVGRPEQLELWPET